MACAGLPSPALLAILLVISSATQLCSSDDWESPDCRAAEGVATCGAAGETEEAGWLQIGTLQWEHQKQKVTDYTHVASTTQPISASETQSTKDQVHKEAPIEEATGEPPAHGVRLNDEGDVEAFWTSCASIVIAVVAAAFVFSILRMWFPLIYSYNVLSGVAPPTAREGLCGWLWAAMGTSVQDVNIHVGLDQAMLLEFANFGMKVAAMLGVPMICVLGPVNYFLGGDDKASHDHTWFSLGNVRSGSPLWWLYAFVVWGVVLTVQVSVYRAQQAFLDLRFEWLRALPTLRANTVLVEGIPDSSRSEKGLFKFFEDIVSGEGNVERAYIVKDTTFLAPMFTALEEAKANLHEAELIWAKAGGDDSRRPQLGFWPLHLLQPRVDSISFYQARIAALEKEVKEERQRLKKAAGQQGSDVNMSVGFVTFYERAEAELALRLDNLSHDSEEWRISTPPDPSDVQWADFTQDPEAERTRTLVGYSLVIGLYFAYMPLVVSMTHLAELIDMGPLQPYWKSIAPSVGLQFMVAFLPTFLLYIFKNFFTLKAATWAQRELQEWYFWFQLVYVVLATAIGQDLPTFLTTTVSDPESLLELFAQTLPECTHFFMSYIMITWFSSAALMIRPFNLLKFLVFRRLYSESEAREMAEPEDQDYYGLGARTTRFTIMFVIMLLYGTLSPLVNLMVFISFAFSRLFYGYLIPFAETKKPDLGGAFWVAQLRHVLVGLLLYCILMVGVLDQQAGSRGPVIIAAPSIVYVLWSMRRFSTKFTWEKLPFQDLMQQPDRAFQKSILFKVYIQPELEDKEDVPQSGVIPLMMRARTEQPRRHATMPKDMTPTGSAALQ
mmetsp:Transcript_3756/g.9911  ORF Transcript_3756/g.9911 Transcript_3756/m.9911 type:complete len:838 (+) Transcript_3756:59-2572(+)